MTNVDQFESMFRAAAREVFRYEPIEVGSVLVVTDLASDEATAFGDRVRDLLKGVRAADGAAWRVILGSEFRTAGELLERVEATAPSLICTYRTLHSTAWRWPYSLGTHLDLLTQHMDIPVLVLPHPLAERTAEHAMWNTNTVMAITDHLAGDRCLVNYGVAFTQPGGRLWLSHVEDEATFARYTDAISKIPAIDTEPARDALREQLLKEPRDYVASCLSALEAEGVPLRVEGLVTVGHHLSEYRSLIEEHRVDLLVLNTKDEDQLAMHGIAYELAVELRQIPLLML